MKITIILVSIFFTLFLHANEKVTLQLKWFHQFQFAGYYAAKEKGFYDEVGLDVQIKQRDLRYNNIEQVINGEAQYGVADSILMLYKAQKQPVVIVSPIFQHSPGVLISLKESGLNSPYKLNNKDILFYPNDTDGFALLSMFKKLNIDANLIRKREKNDYLKLLNKEVDAMPSYLSNEPFYFKQKNIDINIINPSHYGFDFYGDILFTNEEEANKHPERVKKLKEATLKGWEYALNNKEEIIQLIHTKYNKNKSIEHLRYEADVIERLISQDLIPLGTIDEGRIQYIFDLYKEYGLIEKQLDVKKFIFEEFVKKDNKETLVQRGILSDFEKKLLVDQPLNIHITNWEPFTINDTNGYKGLSIDILEELASKADMKLNYVPSKTFVESLQKIKEDKNGLILATSETKGKAVYGSFTKPYASFPISIATTIDKDFIIDLKVLEGKTVAVGRNYTAYILLKKYYPGIKFVLVNNTKEALNLLANSKVYAAADILPALNYNMNKYNFSNLKISGTSKFSFDVRFMLNKNNKELVPILNKLIESIKQGEKKNNQSMALYKTY